jgi:hypothetical protein
MTFIKTMVERVAGGFSKRGPEDIFIDIAGDLYGPQISASSFSLKSGITFDQLFLGPKEDTVIGIDQGRSRFIKIGLKKNPRKRWGVDQEAAILKDLKDRGCVTCPDVIETGIIDRTDLEVILDVSNQSLFNDLPEVLPYVITAYIESTGRMRLADLILALLEQKDMGYYHGDIKPGNIRFDDQNGICILIDYDQAMTLDEQTRELNASDFLAWCDTQEQKRYGMRDWRRHFGNLGNGQLTQFLKNGAFDLSQTSLLRRQMTTNSVDGIYHSIHTRDLFATGSRDLNDRKGILDQIEFSRSESVLDIGCNAGLLCHYLYDRGCQVVGAELDPFMTRAAGFISRMTHRDIEFVCFDLDQDEIPGHFDTIMLFSVLHHSFNIVQNAAKIASACDRIIIECRPVESGKKPNQEAWQQTSKWDYGDLQGLITGLEQLFSGFVLKKNHGMGGKKRYILEFVRGARTT